MSKQPHGASVKASKVKCSTAAVLRLRPDRIISPGASSAKPSTIQPTAESLRLEESVSRHKRNLDTQLGTRPRRHLCSTWTIAG